ncbi:hypothetical protein [Sessilibacter corallicola]|uniref:SnoaL-like domain-containing protein n=1 Tax=Sessilibacter corallicola TaxID=2904075 RepID=A0ABQ0AEK0_9GAMM|nr:hypothetical protein [Sessilibacter corallicola]MCE2028328.1 hypothetical protein [Sessilibacter corallicola]
MNANNARFLLEQYMNGKDNVKPNVLESVFTKHADVVFDIKPNNIYFPDVLTGAKNISTEMFGEFHDKFKDVKSYYVDSDVESLLDKKAIKQQRWLVTMTERETSNTRIGAGYYSWYFMEEGTDIKVGRLEITILEMVSFAAEEDNWLTNLQSNLLDYPWVSSCDPFKTFERYSELETIDRFIK